MDGMVRNVLYCHVADMGLSPRISNSSTRSLFGKKIRDNLLTPLCGRGQIARGILSLFGFEIFFFGIRVGFCGKVGESQQLRKSTLTIIMRPSGEQVRLGMKASGTSQGLNSFDTYE